MLLLTFRSVIESEQLQGRSGGEDRSNTEVRLRGDFKTKLRSICQVGNSTSLHLFLMLHLLFNFCFFASGSRQHTFYFHPCLLLGFFRLCSSGPCPLFCSLCPCCGPCPLFCPFCPCSVPIPKFCPLCPCSGPCPLFGSLCPCFGPCPLFCPCSGPVP